MSFLNSVLSSIGSAEPPKPATARPNPQPDQRAGNQAIGRPQTTPKPTVSSSPASTSSNGTKRKADELDSTTRSKVFRNDAPTPPVASKNGSGSSKPPTLPQSGAHGVARQLKPATVAPKARSMQTSQASASSKPTSPALATAATAAAVPKKGSFQEIMARAKAAQEAPKTITGIQHKTKPVARLSRKEKLAQEEAAKAELAARKRAKKLGRPVPAAPAKNGVAKSRTPGKMAAGAQKQPGEKRRQPTELSYQGTMRSSKPAASPYRGTMGKSTGGRSSSTSALSGSRQHGRHASYSDGEDDDDDLIDDEDDDENDGYDSEGSSDMEAAAYELDEEEQKSLRFARKEDAEAQSEEQELKRRKLARKNMLAKMAAEAAKRKRF